MFGMYVSGITLFAEVHVGFAIVRIASQCQLMLPIHYHPAGHDDFSAFLDLNIRRISSGAIKNQFNTACIGK
ncbi:hypothetical protein D3C85_1768210 [compost metagenome]